MSIVSWPDDVPLGQTVPCVICQQQIALSDATAGRLYADGRQAFACNAHSWSLTQLVSGWVNFAAEQEAQWVLLVRQGEDHKGESHDHQ